MEQPREITNAEKRSYHHSRVSPSRSTSPTLMDIQHYVFTQPCKPALRFPAEGSALLASVRKLSQELCL